MTILIILISKLKSDDEYPVLLREFNEIENNDDIEVLKEYLEIIGSLN